VVEALLFNISTFTFHFYFFTCILFYAFSCHAISFSVRPHPSALCFLSCVRYKKTQETLSQASIKTTAAFSTMGTALSRKLGDMRYDGANPQSHHATSLATTHSKPIVKCNNVPPPPPPVKLGWLLLQGLDVVAVV
jgi:hypothetical protein